MSEAAAREAATQMLDGTLGLAEGTRRIFAIWRALDPADPLHARLRPLAELDARYDLALAGYEDLAALTGEMRARAEILLATLR